MNFFSFCRRGALTGMLLLLGITSAQAADWPRQVTDSYLAALARHRNGRLATFDRGLAALHADVADLIEP